MVLPETLHSWTLVDGAREGQCLLGPNFKCQATTVWIVQVLSSLSSLHGSCQALLTAIETYIQGTAAWSHRWGDHLAKHGLDVACADGSFVWMVGTL